MYSGKGWLKKLMEMEAPSDAQGAEESYLTVFLVKFIVQL